jgi:hypothetical protein
VRANPEMTMSFFCDTQFHPAKRLKEFQFKKRLIKANRTTKTVSRVLFQKLIVLNLVSWSTANSLYLNEVKVVAGKERMELNLNFQSSVPSPFLSYEQVDEESDHLTSMLAHSSLEILLKTDFHSSNLSQLNTSSNYFMNTSFFSSERYNMMPMYGYVLSALFLFLIWIVGTSGNFLVMYLVAKNKQVSPLCS